MSTTSRKVPFYRTVDGIIIPGSFDDDKLRSALNYKPKPGDLFVSTHPKCGTTWAQNIVYLICSGGVPPKTVAELYKMTPFFERVGSESVEKGEEIYAIKTHLPFDRNPYSSLAKYICVVRNPKDVVVSLYHHTRRGTFKFEDGEFDVLFDMFMEGQTEFGDYFDHILSWYEHRLDDNVLFITYEDLKKETKRTVLKIALFMGRKYLDQLENNQEILENVLKYSNIVEMKKLFDESETEGKQNTSTANLKKTETGHIRSGLVGGWRNELSKEQAEKIDIKIKEKFLGTELYDMWKDI